MARASPTSGGRSEEGGKQCVSPEPEECVPGTELEALCGDTKLGVSVYYVERRLEPSEPKAHQSAVDNAIAHIVELGAQQSKNQ